MFGALFDDSDESSDADSEPDSGLDDAEEQRVTLVPGSRAIRLRTLGYHPQHALSVWPGNAQAAAFLAAWPGLRVDGARPAKVLELGAATGALAIFLRVALGIEHVATSDVASDGARVEANIAHNFALNGVAPAPPGDGSWTNKTVVLRPPPTHSHFAESRRHLTGPV